MRAASSHVSVSRRLQAGICCTSMLLGRQRFACIGILKMAQLVSSSVTTVCVVLRLLAPSMVMLIRKSKVCHCTVVTSTSLRRSTNAWQLVPSTSRCFCWDANFMVNARTVHQAYDAVAVSANFLSIKHHTKQPSKTASIKLNSVSLSRLTWDDNTTSQGAGLTPEPLKFWSAAVYVA